MNRAIRFTLAAFVVASCDAPARTPTEPPRAAAPPQMDFSNGPSELPHVVRSDVNLFFVIADFERDLVVVSGAPEDASQLAICGGTEGPEPVPVQFVGSDEGVIKALSVARDTYIRVYSPIGSFRGFFRRKLCLTTPIAEGYGTHLRTDNDLTAAGGRGNSATEKMYGTLQLATGGTARLNATFHYTYLPDGTLQQLKSTVDLTPVGGP